MVIYVVIDEPNVGNQSASSYVLELSRKIMEKAFPYLNITMTDPDAATNAQNQANYDEDYQDYSVNYDDDYDNDAGYYGDDDYDPDYSDWADDDYWYDDDY